MIQNSAQAVAKCPEAMRLPEDHGVQRNREHEGLAGSLLDHFLELAYHRAHKLRGVVMKMQYRTEVVGFDWIRNVKEGTRTGSHPVWLVVARPVHHVAVTRFLEEVGRYLALHHSGTHPSLWGPAFVTCDCGGGFCNQDSLVFFAQNPGLFRVGAPVADELVTPF